MKKKWKRAKILIFSGIAVLVIIAVGIVFSGKIREEINKKGWFANKNELQAIVEQEDSGTEIAERSNQENSDIAVQDNSVPTQAVDTSNWDLTKVDIVYDTANVAVPVPKGYVASGADGEYTVNTGFVIYEGTGEVTNDNAWDESCTRNQWVWVPVPDVSRIYETDSSGKKKSKLYNFSDTGRTSYNNNNDEPGVLSSYDNEKYFARYGLQGMTKKRFLNELQNEFDETIKSIEKYGGFYIGRYETGNLSQAEPVVQRMNTDIGNQAWYTAYTRIKRMSTGTNVRTGMIWGCLWDETLQWLVDSGNKTYAEMKDSTSWGNYSNSTFEYTTTSGSTATKSTSRGTRIPSGSTEYTKANNIYDMAGNLGEGTLEGSASNSHRIRGGGWGINGSSYPAFYRGGYDPTFSHVNISVRAYFNIE